jgi:hypothetical protein
VQHPHWDNYITAQTIFQFQQYCQTRDITVYFFSYFDRLDLSEYEYLINMEQVHPTTITQSIANMDFSHQEIMQHPCFEGKLFHPNIYGHTQIANLLCNKCT